jgi:hypothetical protein
LKQRATIVAAFAVAVCASRVSFAQGAIDASARASWDKGSLRPFVSSTWDLGYLYLRPRLSLGWGRPHAEWIGVEGNPIFQSSGFGAYGGVRAALPFVDLRLGARGFHSFLRSPLEPRPSYTRLDLETTTNEHAQYLTYEAELTETSKLGPGELGALAAVSYVSQVHGDAYVFEETLHVIVKPPWVWRARLSYAFFVLPSLGRTSIGPAVEVLGVPGRAVTELRAGILARVVLSRSLEVRGTFVPAVVSPDAIGIVGGDFTELGLRYRWAERERSPRERQDGTAGAP